MLARMRKSMDEKDQGFTLIELLVVMIIIGILAAIAIPVFLNQRKKAVDTATKSDVSVVGKDIASFYVDGTGTLTVDTTTTAGSATIKSGATVVSTDKLSSGTALQTVGFKATAASESSTWCVAMTNPNGSSNNNWYYSAAAGLNAGACP